MPTALHNARIFDGTEFLDGQAVILNDGKVRKILPEVELPDGFECLNLGGATLAPGFIDTQVNGGGGSMFNDCRDVDSVMAISASHQQFGTTSLLATLISDAPYNVHAAAGAIAKAVNTLASGVIGIHFEGPFLNPDRRGVHREDYVRVFDMQEIDTWPRSELGRLLITVAPECLTAHAIAGLKERGFLVSAGHTLATYDEGRVALKNGISGFTHLFNAMPQLQSRKPGIIAAALQDPNSWCGLIVDGHHVHPAMLKLALAEKPKGKMILVTDAMASVGTDLASFEFQGLRISVESGRCVDASGTLAGSNLSMIEAVQNTCNLLEEPLCEALRMASLYPAEFLGLGNQLGRISPGYRANMVLFNDDFEVSRTWINGEMSSHGI